MLGIPAIPSESILWWRIREGKMCFQDLAVSSGSAEPSLHIQGSSCTSRCSYSHRAMWWQGIQGLCWFVWLGQVCPFQFLLLTSCLPLRRSCVTPFSCSDPPRTGSCALHKSSHCFCTTALAHKENIFLPKELAVLLAGCSTCTVICQRAEGVLDMQVSSGIT